MADNTLLTNPTSVLDPISVDGTVKASAWDAYTHATTPEDFKAKFDKIALPDQAKADLWDMKFKGGLKALSAPTAPAPVTPQPIGLHDAKDIGGGQSQYTTIVPPAGSNAPLPPGLRTQLPANAIVPGMSRAEMEAAAPGVEYSDPALTHARGGNYHASVAKPVPGELRGPAPEPGSLEDAFENHPLRTGLTAGLNTDPTGVASGLAKVGTGLYHAVPPILEQGVKNNQQQVNLREPWFKPEPSLPTTWDKHLMKPAAAGASEAIGGAFEAMGPELLTGLAEAPLHTVVTMAAAVAADKGVSAGAKALGVAPEYADLAGDIAALAAGYATAKIRFSPEQATLLETLQGKGAGTPAGDAARIEKLRTMAERGGTENERRLASIALKRSFGIDHPFRPDEPSGPEPTVQTAEAPQTPQPQPTAPAPPTPAAPQQQPSSPTESYLAQPRTGIVPIVTDQGQGFLHPSTPDGHALVTDELGETMVQGPHDLVAGWLDRHSQNGATPVADIRGQEPAGAEKPQPTVNDQEYLKAHNVWNTGRNKAITRYMNENPGVDKVTAEQAVAGTYGVEPQMEDYKAPPPPPAAPAPPAKPEPPSKVQKVGPQTPNPPTAALPTQPESPETIALQLGQLTTGHRRIVMFPQGQGQPLTFPPGVQIYHDPFGNTYAYNPQLISKSEISSAAKNNKLPEILGHPETGLGAPDKSALQGEPAAVTAHAPDGTEVQSTATDEQNLQPAIDAAHAVTPEGGHVTVGPVADVLGGRQGQGAAPAPAADSQGDRQKQHEDTYQRAVALVREAGKASTSILQRNLRVGYGDASAILDRMHREGVIGPPNGSAPREVLAPAPTVTLLQPEQAEKILEHAQQEGGTVTPVENPTGLPAMEAEVNGQKIRLTEQPNGTVALTEEPAAASPVRISESKAGDALSDMAARWRPEAVPVRDAHGTPTGWLELPDQGHGTLLIHPAENRVVTFVSRDEAPENVARARAEAQVYAASHPVPPEQRRIEPFHAQRDFIDKFPARDNAGRPMPTANNFTYFTGKTDAAVAALATARSDMGLMISPDFGHYLPQIEHYPVVTIDNGAFYQTPTTPEVFEAFLGDVAQHPQAKQKVYFVVAPDVVGDPQATLDKFDEWEQKIHAHGLPVAFVAQDGIENMLDQVPWDRFEVLFIGGSTEWKIGTKFHNPQEMNPQVNAANSQMEKQWRAMFKRARAEGKPVHFGRVNSYKRAEIVQYGLGEASGDGTYLAFGPDKNLPQLESWLNRLNYAPDNHVPADQPVASDGTTPISAVQTEILKRMGGRGWLTSEDMLVILSEAGEEGEAGYRQANGELAKLIRDGYVEGKGGTVAFDQFRRTKKAVPQQVAAPADQPVWKPGRDFILPEQPTAPEATGVKGLVNAIYQDLQNGGSLGNITKLNQLGEKYLGGPRAAGNWTPKDLYDAMEAGVNRYLIDHGAVLLAEDGIAGLTELRQLMSRLTTQGIRTDEQIANQQFSTPPTLSYVAAKVASLRPDDVVLEPSAGNGGLAAWPKSIGVDVFTNEISPRRREMLEAAGLPGATAHDGELINALLDRSIQPTVVLMNPPFSASTLKSHTARNNNTYGFNHVESALQRLAPGGRLVAILGGGQANEPEGGASFTNKKSGDWFRKIADRYNIRANIRINGKEYAKYGTSFATRLIVIDKTGPTEATPESRFGNVVRLNVDTLEQAYEALRAIAADRPAALRTSLGGGPVDATSEGARGGIEPAAQPGNTTGVAGSESGAGGPPDTGAGGTGITGIPPRSGQDSNGPELAGGPGAVSGPPERVQPETAGGGTPQQQPDVRPPRHNEPESSAGAGAIDQHADEQQPAGASGVGNPELDSIIDDVAAGLEALLGKPPEPTKAPAPTQASSATKAPRPAQKRTAKAPKASAPAPPAHPLEQAAIDAERELRELLGDIPNMSVSEQAQQKAKIDRAILTKLGIIGGKKIVVDGLVKFDDWGESMMKQVGDLIRRLGQTSKLPAPEILRQIHIVASAAAKRYNVEAEPTPPESDFSPTGDRLNLERQDQTLVHEEDTDAYVKYQPTLKGPQHPGEIVETKTMATVPLPVMTYRPALPQAVIDNKAISNVQLEAIAMVGQQNDLLLPGGYRASALIGDGTGVGKGREAAGILWDNWRQGRRRLVWVTEKNDLMQDAARDFSGIGAGPDILANVTQLPNGRFVFNPNARMKTLASWNGKADIKHEGVIFVTYALLRSEAKTGGTRAEQLRKWLAGDDNGDGGYILFDEAHNLKNAVPSIGSVGSKTGIRARQLLADIPGLRSASLSATAATEISNLGYLDRLGLWGPGTSFPGGFMDFQTAIGSGRMAAMELVARELKAQGKYISRTLSFKGVSQEIETHELNEDQKAIYRTAATAWQQVFKAAQKTIADTTNGGKDARSRFNSEFRSAQLRFFNILVSTLKIPTAVKLAEAALADNKSVVITLVNTNEAAQNREKEKISARNAQRVIDGETENEEEEQEYDFGPKEMLVNLIEKNYPVQQWTDDVDPNGKPVKVPVFTVDADGNKTPLNNPQAEDERDALIADINRDLHMPGNPLDVLIEALGGRNQVAELTGRKERYDEATGEFISRGDPGTARKDINIAEMKKFQNGDKRVAVLSSAAGTGISLHADKGANNQQKRVQITLQVGWSADKQMQMFGRTHRTNQAHAPEYIMLVSDLGGEKRFIATIARRLGSLGALTKGQKNASAGADMMDKVNFETDQGRAAARAFYDALQKNVTVPGSTVGGMDVLRSLGVGREDEDSGKIEISDTEKRNVTRLLNRLLALDPDIQNAFYNYYYDLFEANVRAAIEDGTLDTGVKALPGDVINVKEERLLTTDPQTGAKTFYYPVDSQSKIERISPESLEKKLAFHKNENPRILRNEKGKVALAINASPIVRANGSVDEAARVATPGNAAWRKVSLAELTRLKMQSVDEWALARQQELQSALEKATRESQHTQRRYDDDLTYKRERLTDAARSDLKRAENDLQKYRDGFERAPLIVSGDVRSYGSTLATLAGARSSGYNRWLVTDNAENRRIIAGLRYLSVSGGNQLLHMSDAERLARIPEAERAVAEAQVQLEAAAEAPVSADEWSTLNLKSAQEDVAKAGTELAAHAPIVADPVAWAKEQWSDQYDASPSHATDEYHLIGGAVLKYWNAIREASPLLDIYTTVDSKTGQRIVGVSVMPQTLNSLLARISGGRATITTGQLLRDVLINGTTFNLEGGIRVTRGRVARTPVIQFLVSNDTALGNLKNLGVITERGITPIHYLPTDASKQSQILSQILKDYPVIQDTDIGEAPAFSIEGPRNEPDTNPPVLARYREGVIYTNAQGMAALGRIWGSRLNGVQLPSAKQNDAIANHLISNPDTEALGRMIRAHASDRNLIVVVTGRGITALKHILRHERFHNKQQTLPLHLSKYEKPFLRHPLAQRAGTLLTKLGYPVERHAVEIGADLAAGQFQRLGLTVDEGRTLARVYFGALRAEHGNAAVDRIVVTGIVPAIAKEARAYAGTTQEATVRTTDPNSGGTRPDSAQHALRTGGVEGDEGGLRRVVRQDVPGQGTGGEAGGRLKLEQAPAASLTIPGPTWFSQLQKTIEGKMPAKASPAQVAAIVGNPQNRVKADEVKWTGLRDWLHEQKGMLTKQEVLGYLRMNGVEVKEVLHGGPAASGSLNRVRELQAERRRLEEEYRTTPGDDMPDEFYARRDANRAAMEALTAQVGPPTKYKEYTTRGGKDYGELLLTLPRNTGKRWEVFDPREGKAVASFDTAEEAHAEADRRGNGFDYAQKSTGWDDPTEYKSSHWGEPNIVAHIRFTTRTTPGGERVLHIEEIQSDWHQQGRAKGYQPTGEEKAALETKLHTLETERRDAALNVNKIVADRGVLIGKQNAAVVMLYGSLKRDENNLGFASPDRALEAIYDNPNWVELFKVKSQRVIDDAKHLIQIGQEFGKAASALARANDHHFDVMGKITDLTKKLKAGVPDAPFSKTWHELAFRRAVRWAAENGFDRISWATGKQSADRYNLAKHVSKVTWTPSEFSRMYTEATGSLERRGNLQAFDKSGNEVISKQIDEADLPDYIGKEVARKLLETPPVEAQNPRRDDLPVYNDEGQRLHPDTAPAHILEGDNLQVGGHGMNEFYDQIIPRYAAKFGSKFGAKVEDTQIKTPTKSAEKVYSGPTWTVQQLEDYVKETSRSHGPGSIPDVITAMTSLHQNFKSAMELYGTDVLAQRLGGTLKPKPQSVAVQSLPITNAMVNSVMEGQPLFQIRNDGSKKQAGPSSVTLGSGFGAAQPQLEAFYERDLKPGAKALSQTLSGAIDDLKKVFAPDLRGPEALRAAGQLRERGAEMDQRRDRALALLKGMKKYFLKQPEQHGFYGLDTWNAVETGRTMGLSAPELAFARAARALLDPRWAELHKLGILNNYIDNYLPREWKDPAAGQNWVQNWQARRPLAGSEAFKKQRTYPTMQEGLDDPDFNMVPKFDNPVDMLMHKLGQMDQSITAHRVFEEAHGKGDLKYVPAGSKPPLGWQKIDDKLFTVYGPRRGGVTIDPGSRQFGGKQEPKPLRTDFGHGPGRYDLTPEEYKDFHDALRDWRDENVQPEDVVVHGQRIMGHYYAPEPIARVFNNYLSRGINDSDFVTAVRSVNNFMNAVQLTASFYHGLTTVLNSTFSDIALGIEQALPQRLGGAGKPATGAIAAARGIIPFASAIHDVFKGTEILKAWDMQPADFEQLKQTDPGMWAIVDALKAAGGKPRQDQYYQEKFIDALKDEWAKGNPGGALLRAIPALAEWFMKPIMEQLVPRVKLGAFAKLAAEELQRYPTRNRDELRQRMGQIWNSVDNRFGQLAQRNLIMHSMARTAMNVAFGRPGWNLGVIQELIGGTNDAASNVADILRGRPTRVSHKTAFVMALLLGGVLINAIVSYLLSGEDPEGVDYIAPRDGGVTEDGRPSRIILPTYLSKDVYSYMTRPARTLIAKASPILSVTGDLLRDRDFYDRKIWGDRGIGILNYVRAELLPYSLSGLAKNRERHASVFRQALPFVGIMPAGKRVGLSPAEQMITEYQDEQSANTRPPDSQRNKAKMEVFMAARTNPQKAYALGTKYVAAGEIAQGDVKRAVERAALRPLVADYKHVTDFPTAMRIFNVASDAEKKMIAAEAQRKANLAAARPWEWRTPDGDPDTATINLAWKYFHIGPGPNAGHNQIEYPQPIH